MTTAQRRRLSERDIAALAVKAIEAAAHERGEGFCHFGRAEVVVTLPQHGQVSCDAACEMAESLSHFGVVEAKARLTRELEAQAMRWAGYVNYVWVAYEAPKVVTVSFLRRQELLERAGVGRAVLVDGAVAHLRGAVFQQADTRLFSKAYFSSDGSIDPVAGSAAALRATPARCQWESLRKWFRNINCDGSWRATWKTIRRQVPEMRAYTCAAAQKAIDKGECIGIDYDPQSSPTEFFAK